VEQTWEKVLERDKAARFTNVRVLPPSEPAWSRLAPIYGNTQSTLPCQMVDFPSGDGRGGVEKNGSICCHFFCFCLDVEFNMCQKIPISLISFLPL
jgi:hypothetical protein